MAQDLVTRLILEDKGFGNTVANARKSLQDFSNQASTLDNVRQRFNQIQNGTAPLAKSLADTKKEMHKLAQAGLQGTDTFAQLAQACAKYKQELNGVDDAIKGAIKAQEKLNGAGSLSELFSSPKKAIGDLMGSAGLGGVSSALGAIATPAGAAVAAGGALIKVCVDAGKAAAEFETSLTSLGALTGLQGEDLASLGESAKDLAATYGSSANDVLASMEVIGSQAPELLKNKDALVAVTDAANVLAKASGMEVADAASAITTTMNQLGVSADEAMSIVNTLGAGAQQGSAGIEYLSTAFEKAGTQAKGAGMSYTELTAAIETIAPKFSSADVAGTALNGTLLKLSQAEDKFNPQVVGMSKALENLAEAQLNNSEMSKLVGESNITMLSSLIEGREQFDKYSESLNGTTTAQDMAAQKMATFEERVKRLKTSWDNFLIGLGSSAIIQGTMDLLAKLGESIMAIVNALADVFAAQDEASGGFNVFTLVIDNLGRTLDVVVGIIKGVCAVLEMIYKAIAKAINYVKNVAIAQWNKMKQSFGDTKFVKAIIGAFNSIKTAFQNMYKWIIDKWNKLCDALGMKSKKIKIDADVNTNTNTTTSGSNNGSGNGGGNNNKGGKGSKSKKETAPQGSIKWIEEQISKEKNKLSMLSPEATAEDADVIKDKIKELQADLLAEKLRLDVITPKEYLAELKKQVQESFDEIKMGNVDTSDFIKTVDYALKEVEGMPIDFAIEIKKDAIDKVKSDFKKISDALMSGLIDERQANIEFKKLSDMYRALGKDPIELKLELDKSKIDKAKAQIASIQDQYNRGLISEDEAFKSIANINRQLQKLGEKPVEIKLKPKIEKTELSPQVQSLFESQSNAQSNAEDLKKMFELGIINKEEFEKGIDDINNKLKELNLPPIDFKVNGKGQVVSAIDEITNGLSNLLGTISSMGGEMTQMMGKITGLGNSFKEFDKLKGMLDNLSEDQFAKISQQFGGLSKDSIKTVADLSKIGGVMSTVGEVAGSLGQSLEQLGAGSAIAKIGMIAGAIGQLVLGYATATAQAASMGPWAWIAFAISGLATLTSVIASISQFEEGGIVGGNSYKGDKILARVNSGEMILNQKQQASLYKMISGKNAMVNTVQPSGEVTFTLQGSTLKGCLNNYDKKMSKIKN